MKQNYFLLTILLLISNAGFSQDLIQASLGPGIQPNSIKIYLKAASTQSASNLSTLQFNIGVDTAVSPQPTMTVLSTTVGVTWDVTGATEGGFYNYRLTTGGTPSPSLVANTEYEVMEVVFNGGPVTAKNVALVSLPGGGQLPADAPGNSYFYCNSSLFKSDGSNLYYSRAGVTVNNVFSYDADGVGGTGTSTATISGILLPIKWLDFSVVRQSNNALLQWSVTNSGNISEFEIEKSVNGVDFTPVSSIKNASALQTGSFKFSDVQLTNYNSTIVFYRIKQKDINGQISYSDIRSLKLNLKGGIVMYPNPATAGFYLQVPFINPGSKKVLLQLRNALNQVVEKRELTESQASNYYFDLKNNAILTGNYSLQIYSDGKLLDTKNIMVSK